MENNPVMFETTKQKRSQKKARGKIRVPEASRTIFSGHKNLADFYPDPTRDPTPGDRPL